jgi:hypothetical protein
MQLLRRTGKKKLNSFRKSFTHKCYSSSGHSVVQAATDMYPETIPDKNVSHFRNQRNKAEQLINSTNLFNYRGLFVHCTFEDKTVLFMVSSESAISMCFCRCVVSFSVLYLQTGEHYPEHGERAHNSVHRRQLKSTGSGTYYEPFQTF